MIVWIRDCNLLTGNNNCTDENRKNKNKNAETL